MTSLAVILVNARFPENIGMVARACANMGCDRLILVNPERWDLAKAAPLATPKGLPVLETVEFGASLGEALAPFTFSAAATARLGGWRRKIMDPEQAAIALATAANAALVLGPEDRGLSNAEISQCSAIAHIPTASAASSLNLAQAALIMLYEWRKAKKTKADKKADCVIAHSEQIRLESSLKETLLALDCLHGQNPDYFFIQWRNILRRAGLTRHEYDCLMGFSRQIRNKIIQIENDEKRSQSPRGD